MSKSIESLPNIDLGLAVRLRQVGITDADALIRIGAGKAWQRLLRQGWQGGIDGLLRLEGAISGVRWTQVPLDRQQELCLEVVAYSQGVR
ncbi:MAG: TfoX/Sxy family DNA transformation protein [Verrucomicrobia bacterium]|nr:TfoX/Sxy family DNA transformation protein [Verrucomicrobiota bacterium]